MRKVVCQSDVDCDTEHLQHARKNRYEILCRLSKMVKA